MKRVLLWAFLGLVAIGARAQMQPYDTLFVFGDSYSDTGAGYVDGNGPTAVWYMAKQLGIDLLVPAKAMPGSSLNFAVSGAKTGAGSGSHGEHGELLGYGMRNQVDDFAQMVNKGKVKFDAAKTMFYFAGGLNDSSLPVETSKANIEGEIETLYGLGARRFMVALLTEKIPGFGLQGKRLNPSLASIPVEMKAKHPDMQITTSEWGHFFDVVLENAAKYGITNTTDACAGRALFHEDATPCAAPASYYFYHAHHPSTRTHEAVGEMLAAEAKGVK